MTTQFKVSYSFVKLPDAAIADFTDTVNNAMLNNPGFPNPPVSLPVLETQKADFLAKLAATAQGGTLATAVKNDARDVLIASLRQLAAYVQSVASTDITLLLSSGFQPVSTNRAQSPLDTPLVLNIDNTVSGQLVVRLQSVANARAYEVQIRDGAGSWTGAGIFTQARRIELDALNPGDNYTVQARAIGGSTGYSGWSNPTSRIVT